MADAGGLPTAEHPAPDGRYPKAYDLPRWRWILRRKDVLVVPVDQCEYGLGPADGGPADRYRKRSWLVTCVRQLQDVARRCSQQHTHVELKGTDAVKKHKRTADAGRYPQRLLQAITQAMIQEALQLGAVMPKRGGELSQSRSSTEPGGGEPPP